METHYLHLGEVNLPKLGYLVIQINAARKYLEGLESKKDEILAEESLKAMVTAKAKRDLEKKEKKAALEAKKAAQRQSKMEKATTSANAMMCVNTKPSIYYQIFSELDGERFYYSNGGRRKPVTDDMTVCLTSEARAAGHPVLFKGQPYRHPKDTSQP